MLVSGLANEALSKIVSNSHGNYAGVHQALCECTEAMVNKYEQRQETPENKSKLRAKTQAATILFKELSKISKTEAGITQKALLSALDCHAKALEGYEHLMPEKGNNYQLMKQTQGLREGQALASLLRYHNLKNKLLEPGSSLSDAQRAFISKLNEKKLLSLESLEILEEDHGLLTTDVMRVTEQLASEAEQDQSNLFAEVLKYKKSSAAEIDIIKHLKASVEQSKVSEQGQSLSLDEAVKIRSRPAAHIALEILKEIGQSMSKSDDDDEVVKHETPAPMES